MTKAHKSTSNHINVGSVMFITAIVLVVGAAMLARSGYTGKEHAVGIDLGTTYSVVAISQRNNVTVIPDANGHLIIPSIVSYLPNGETLVGRSARAHRIDDPKNTIFNAKRFIGRSYSDIIESKEDFSYEFKVTKQEESDDACFQLQFNSQYSPCKTPIEIGSAIIRHLKIMAQDFVGHDQITKAVIAVPVDFNKVQREATASAFEKAGLTVSGILEEPTAAALAYGLHQDPSVQFIIVFDFGGGTLDVSLLYVRSGSIRVIDTMGNNHLGGEDVDELLSNELIHLIQEEIGTTIHPQSSTSSANINKIEAGDEPTNLPCTMAGVRRGAETLKRYLSYHSTGELVCVIENDGSKYKKGETVTISFSRQQLEDTCRELFELTMKPVQDILQANHMTTDEIDQVVLVGGSTRIPFVRHKLTEMFNGRPPLSSIDPDIAVAYGAATIAK